MYGAGLQSFPKRLVLHFSHSQYCLYDSVIQNVLQTTEFPLCIKGFRQFFLEVNMMGIVIRLSLLVGAVIVVLHGGQIVSNVTGASVNVGQVGATMHQAVQGMQEAVRALGS